MKSESEEREERRRKKGRDGKKMRAKETNNKERIDRDKQRRGQRTSIHGIT